MINELKLEGCVKALEKVKEGFYLLTLSQVVYERFETDFQIIIYNHPEYEEHLEDSLEIGDEVIIENISVYLKDDLMKFKLNKKGFITKKLKPIIYDKGILEVTDEFWNGDK